MWQLLEAQDSSDGRCSFEWTQCNFTETKAQDQLNNWRQCWQL